MYSPTVESIEKAWQEMELNHTKMQNNIISRAEYSKRFVLLEELIMSLSKKELGNC